MQMTDRRYIKRINRRFLDDWSCVTYSLEEAKIFQTEKTVNRAIASVIGCIKNGTTQTKIDDLLKWEMVSIRVTASEYPPPITVGSLRCFEKLITDNIAKL